MTVGFRVLRFRTLRLRVSGCRVLGFRFWGVGQAPRNKRAKMQRPGKVNLHRSNADEVHDPEY